MKKLGFIIFIVLFFSHGASAQKEWSLEDCIKYALDNNIQIKRQALLAEMYSNNYEQSRFERLPNLNAGLSHSLSSGRNLDYSSISYVTNTFQNGSLGLQSNLTVFNGMQTENKIKQNKLLLLKSLQDSEKAKNDIILNIATAYLQILLDQELLNTSEKQYEVATLQSERVAKLVEVGNKAKGDLLEMQAQAANEKVNITTATNDLKISILTLTQLLDLDSTSGFQIKRPDSLQMMEVAYLSTIDSVYHQALDLPQIKSAELDMKSYEKALDVAKGSRYPTVSLSASLSTWYNQNNLWQTYFDTAGVHTAYRSYKNQLKDNYYKQVNLNISIPIFNRRYTSTSIKNAKLNLLDSRYRLDQANLALYKQIQLSFTDAIAANEKHVSAQEAVKSNEESFKYIQQKFEVGLANSVDYNISKNKLINAQSLELQAKYMFIFKTKILDFYRGKRIEL
jgi:outer membrane protein